MEATFNYSKNPLGFIKFARSLGIAFTRQEICFPLRKELLEKNERDFYDAYRPIFLKYLTKVEPSIQSLMSPREFELLKNEGLTSGWTVHHQKPLFWCGNSAWISRIEKVRKYPLTDEETMFLTAQRNPESMELKIKLDKYFSSFKRPKDLRKAFINVFGGFLILMKTETHNKLEKEFYEKQKFAFLKDCNRHPKNFEKGFTLTYFHWYQLVMDGEKFDPIGVILPRVRNDFQGKQCRRRVADYRRRLLLLKAQQHE